MSVLHLREGGDLSGIIACLPKKKGGCFSRVLKVVGVFDQGCNVALARLDELLHLVHLSKVGTL